MEVEIEKIILSNAFGYDINKETDAKYFTGYETDNKSKPLFIEASRMAGYHIVYKTLTARAFQSKIKNY